MLEGVNSPKSDSPKSRTTRGPGCTGWEAFQTAITYLHNILLHTHHIIIQTPSILHTCAAISPSFHSKKFSHKVDACWCKFLRDTCFVWSPIDRETLLLLRLPSGSAAIDCAHLCLESIAVHSTPSKSPSTTKHQLDMGAYQIWVFMTTQKG